MVRRAERGGRRGSPAACFAGFGGAVFGVDLAGITRGSGRGVGFEAGFAAGSGFGGAMALTAFGEGQPGLPGDVLQSTAAWQVVANAMDRRMPAVTNAVLVTRPSNPPDAATRHRGLNGDLTPW